MGKLDTVTVNLQLLAHPDRTLLVIMKNGTIYKQLTSEPHRAR
jgi:hypothetical protein